MVEAACAFLIGAQKAGTTTLAELLDQHPDVCLSTPKEPHFYSKNFERGAPWYDACFEGVQKRIRLDASTTYAMAEPGEHAGHVAARIAAAAPDARIIYIVRDPVERTHSAYWHSVRSGSETLPFRKAVETNPRYVATGQYFFQLSQYLKYFPKDRIRMVDFNRLRDDPMTVAAACLAFLGCDSEKTDLATADARNKSYRYSPVGMLVRRAAGSHERMTALAGAVQAATPRFLHAPIKSLVARDVPRLEEADRAWLAPFFDADLAALHSYCGIELRRTA
ncbi:MAG: sulfotransferase domain-containing protein [Pseudomonadota bacterium]